MEEWWEESEQQGRNSMHTFQLKLKELKKNLRKCNKEEFGHNIKD